MMIGVPCEIKPQEFRVGLTPESVFKLSRRGHAVVVERDAGAGIGVTDEIYRAAGARILDQAAEVYSQAALVVKVKEPQAHERQMLREGQVLFSYLHLAPDPEQAHDLMASGAVCIAYETVTDVHGGLPLLKPMSQVAGRMALQAGAWALERSHGGRGVLLGGVPGVAPAKVLILGGGTVGFNAAQMAVGLQADVTLLDQDPKVLEGLAKHFGAQARVIHSNESSIQEQLRGSSLVIGAVLVPGGTAPKLLNRGHLAGLPPGAVLIDVAIDQGGCFETSRPTTHAQPTFVDEGIVHYCVSNMPGAVPHTSTYALNNAILPFVLMLADKGWRRALLEDQHLGAGLNVCAGRLTHPAVAQAIGAELTPVETLLGRL